MIFESAFGYENFGAPERSHRRRQLLRRCSLRLPSSLSGGPHEQRSALLVACPREDSNLRHTV